MLVAIAHRIFYALISYTLHAFTIAYIELVCIFMQATPFNKWTYEPVVLIDYR